MYETLEVDWFRLTFDDGAAKTPKIEQMISIEQEFITDQISTFLPNTLPWIISGAVQCAVPCLRKEKKTVREKFTKHFFQTSTDNLPIVPESRRFWLVIAQRRVEVPKSPSLMLPEISRRMFAPKCKEKKIVVLSKWDLSSFEYIWCLDEQNDFDVGKQDLRESV